MNTPSNDKLCSADHKSEEGGRLFTLRVTIALQAELFDSGPRRHEACRSQGGSDL